jgi:exopolysaccharide biosynthesis protein
MMKMKKSKENKKLSIILIRILLFLIPTFIVLFVIGTHSSYLIKTYIKWTVLVFLIISIILLIFSVIVYIRNKDTGHIPHKKKWRIIYYMFISLYTVGCITFLVLLYGPYSGFRDWLISTAMQTMHHQYYCKWFYNDDDIAKVMSTNYIIEANEDTDASLVDGKEETYANEYEKQILKKDSKNQVYKIVRFKVNGQNAYLAAIYDPSRVSVAVTKWLRKSGQYVTDMAKENKASLAINGGGFVDFNYSSTGGTPLGVTISNGVSKTFDNNVATYGGIIGFNKQNVLVLLKGKTTEQALQMGVRDAVTMGPFLVVNGKASFVSGNGGWGYAARTAIGQRKDGIVLFLVVDSNATRTKGATMYDMTTIMKNYGAINASALDGGTSSVMVENGALINDPIDSTLAHKTRPVASAFIVK